MKMLSPVSGSRRVMQQALKLCRVAVVGLSLFEVAFGQGLPNSDLDKLAGQPLDIAPSAYPYRADRPPAQNPPEAEFLFRAIKHEKAAALYGLLWEEPRMCRRIELHWRAAAENVPPPDQIAVQWFPPGNSTGWWSRDKAVSAPQWADKPDVSSDGRTFTYTVDITEPGKAIDNLVVLVKDGSQSEKRYSVPTIRVFSHTLAKRIDAQIEWGFQPGAASGDFGGHVEVYNGALGKVSALPDGGGTRITADNAWVSRGTDGRRRGIVVPLCYLGGPMEPIGKWPADAQARASADSVYNRTIVSVHTRSGRFAFVPADLESGPILAPEYGFFVAKAEADIDARSFQKELAAQNLRTIRQRVRQHPEQSWEQAMQAMHPGEDLPPIPRPEYEPAMQVAVPSARLTDQWRCGVWHLLRVCKKDPNGRWIFADHPYPPLALETFQILRTLDVMGMHKETRDGLRMWLDKAGEGVPIPFGFFDSKDCFTGVDATDTHHSSGAGPIHWVMLEHYALTGDRQWLKEVAPKLNGNADWMLRQRRKFMESLPGSERAWCYGLQPPHNIWDENNERVWYESEAQFYRALKQHGQVIGEIDPAAGRAYLSEAEHYGRNLRAAVEKSLALSPLIRVRDGTYRSFVPPGPYFRGPSSRFMPRFLMRWGGLYPDVVRGGVRLVEWAGLLSAEDARAQGFLDVLEDRLLLENDHLKDWTRDYDPATHWFSYAGWFAQPGIERTPDIHLLWDDIPNFLRSWLNAYAVEVLPNHGYTFKEHPIRSHGVTDKSFEEAAFLERFRNLLVMEDSQTLWLARATPRAWLASGQRITVKNAPSHFGTVAYEIVSDVDHGKISATVELPSRNPPQTLLLRFRHPQALPIRSVEVNGRPWAEFDPEKEVVRLSGLTGKATVSARY